MFLHLLATQNFGVVFFPSWIWRARDELAIHNEDQVLSFCFFFFLSSKNVCCWLYLSLYDCIWIISAEVTPLGSVNPSSSAFSDTNRSIAQTFTLPNQKLLQTALIRYIFESSSSLWNLLLYLQPSVILFFPVIRKIKNDILIFAIQCWKWNISKGRMSDLRYGVK